MTQKKFGPTKFEIPAIGQGTWFLEEAPRARAVDALRMGIDLGMTHIDTAELYGNGAAEKLVGEAIQGRRDEIFLVSKVQPQNASRKGTLAACEKSLTRLGTDRLDCYLIHWRGPHPLEETFAAMISLVEAGKIVSFGVSNFDIPDLEETLAIVGKGRIACNQVFYHLGQRAIEHAVLPWCEKHDVAVVGYSPFGHDDFPEPESKAGRVLAEIADHYGATPRQVALSFLARDRVLFAIPKATSPDHVKENAGAAALHLSASDNALIEREFPLGPRPAALPTI